MPNPPRLIEHAGKILTLDQWAAESGIPAGTLRSRLDHLGWDAARALTTPAAKKFSRRPTPGPGAVPPCPPMREHASGQGYCDWTAGGTRRFRYFGKWQTEEANREYARFAAEWTANAGAVVERGRRLLVTNVVAAYVAHADAYYRKRGRRTSEWHGVRAAMRALNDLYGDQAAADFGPNKLRAVQSHWVAEGKARKTANEYTWKVVRAFKWAVGREMVPAAVADALEQVGVLQRGRTDAPDRPRKRPVPAADLESVLPHLHAHAGRRAVLESMLRLHWLVGCRPQDITGMRAGDIDRRGDVWRWVADAHKQEHRATLPLVYLLGPRAQAVLAPLLADLQPGDPVFVYPARRRAGKRWAVSRTEYGRRVKAACAAANVKPWTPHQLRHTHATRVAEEFGSVEAAAAAIGDDPETAAAVYVHLDPLEKAKRLIALRLG